MPSINIPKYHSQLDGDNGGAKGACGETCLKMIDTYLTGREIPISAIIANGDKDPLITSTAGMIKAADWLGFGMIRYSGAVAGDYKNWLAEGKLVVAAIDYSKWPDKYKHDGDYDGGHFILITGITDDLGAIRFADPYFRDGLLIGRYGGRYTAKREDGWMKNNKWATWADFYNASYHGKEAAIAKNGTALVAQKAKEVTPPPPPVDPCAGVKAERDQARIERDSLKTQLLVAEDNFIKERIKNAAEMEHQRLLHEAAVGAHEVNEASLSSRIEEVTREYNVLAESHRKLENTLEIVRKDLDQTVRDKDEVIEGLRQEKENLQKEAISAIGGIDLVLLGIQKLLRR